MKKDAVSNLLKVAAALATRRPLHAIDELCDMQKQVSSARLYDMVEVAGDELAGYSVQIRDAADAVTATKADLVDFLTMLRANVQENGPRSLLTTVERKLEELKNG